MAFHVAGGFGGALGIFNCNCGYKNSSYSNFSYATKVELDKFYEDAKDIMWK